MFSKDEIKTPRIFRPYGNINIAATTASTSAVALITETNAPTEQPHVRLTNTSTASAVQFNFASGTTGTAGSNSAYLMPGQCEIFDRGVNTHLAVVSVTGTCQVSATTGLGVYSGS